MYTTSITTTLRRLALAAGLVLALAAPSAATASFTVPPERVPEGNDGVATHYMNVVAKCDDQGLTANQRMNMQGGSCLFEAEVDKERSTLRAIYDAIWDPFWAPAQSRLKRGGAIRLTLSALVAGDKLHEPDETLVLKVTEHGFTALGNPVYTRTRNEVGLVVLNDDRAITKTLGKRAPVNALESNVERYPWDDGTSVGANCLTKPNMGWKGAHKAWGFYVPGCLVTIACPEGRACVAHARSTIKSDAAERVTLSQRLGVPAAGGNAPALEDTGCQGTQECTATDDSTRIPSGGTATLQCNGVHALKTASAEVVCSLDLEFVE